MVEKNTIHGTIEIKIYREMETTDQGVGAKRLSKEQNTATDIFNTSRILTCPSENNNNNEKLVVESTTNFYS